MGSRYEVEVSITKAKDVKNVNWRNGPNKAYAVAWVDPDRKVTTRVDEEGDTSPRWDQTLIIPLDHSIQDATLYIDIVHAYPESDTKPLIGSAKLNLREVVDEAGMGSNFPTTLKLKRPSGRPQGKLDLEVTIRDPRYQAPDPYHPPPYGVTRDSGYGYGQPGYRQPEYGHGQAGYGQPEYGHGQPGYGYGYGERVEEEKKESKFGGMGTGLAVGAVAGVLGGLALAEGYDQFEDHIADEAAERVQDDLEDGGDE